MRSALEGKAPETFIGLSPGLGHGIWAALTLTQPSVYPQFINLKLLQAMKKKAVLETEPGPTSWKIQALLGKISRGLNFLSLSDLEHLIEVVQEALSNLSARKSRIWL